MSAPTTTGRGVMATDEPVLPSNTPGLYLCPRLGGITAHLTANPATVSTVRRLTLAVLLAYGLDQDTAENAQLVLSELIGNAVRVGGPHVPLVAEIYVAAGDAVVALHDPVIGITPRRAATEPDSPVAESGRGLVLLDVLAPNWRVELSPVGKRIRCRIPH